MLFAAIFAGAAQLLRLFLLDPGERLSPAWIFAPNDGALDCGARQTCALEKVEGVAGDCALHFRVFRSAHGIAKRKIAEEETRDAAFLHNVSCRSSDDGRNAGFFEMTRDQTHGLVTNRSKRNEQRDIDLVFSAAF